MKRLALLAACAVILGLGGCQAVAGAIGGAVRDIQSGIDMAARLNDAARPRYE